MAVEWEQVLALKGVVTRSGDPAMVRRVDAARRRGALVPVLPGVYAQEENFLTRCLAVGEWAGDAVLLGSTAARLSWWPELRDATVRVSTRRRQRRQQPLEWLAITRRRVPDGLAYEHQGLRIATPALAALGMAGSPEHGALAIDEALRRRVVTVAQLHAAVAQIPWWPANPEVRRLLRESRDNPWSPLEREAHTLLRREGITGWVANLEVRVGQSSIFLDLAFLEERVAVEIDGYAFHHSRASFAADRWRDVQLTLAGWTVLRFTSETLAELPAAIKSLRRGRKRPDSPLNLRNRG